MRGLLQFAFDFLAEPAPAARLISEENRPQVSAEHGVAAPDSIATEGALSCHPQANRQARLGTSWVGFQLLRARRRSIGFLIGPEGLTVRAPVRATLRDIDAAVQEKAGWIVRKLGEMSARERTLADARIDWSAPGGVTLGYLGAPLRVVADAAVGRARPAPETAADGLALLRLPARAGASADTLRDATEVWLRQRARELFTARLHHFAPALGVTWRGLALSSAATRWGSASSSGHIRLNWRLVHLRPELIDYVVVHELSHLRVMDHSPRFWAVVASAMPGYAAVRAELKAVALARWR